MPSTRIAFSPRLRRSRPSRGAHVEPGQLAHAVEAVADGVAVGEQASRPSWPRCRRPRGRTRACGPARSRTARRRPRAAPPSPRGSAAARWGPRSSRAAAAGRRRSPRTRAALTPRASATLAASSASAPARCRSTGSAAGRLSVTTSGETVEAQLHLLEHRVRGAAARARAVAGHEDHQLAVGRRGRGSPAGAVRQRARRSQLDRRSQRGALHRARAAPGHGEHARAPVALLGVLGTRAGDDDLGRRRSGRSRAPPLEPGCSRGR